jgi:hypothetical protein
MGPLVWGEAIAGGALLFFLPGFAVAKAVFPERRVAGPGGVRWAVELVTLSFVLSVVFTVAVGYFLLVGSPSGFAAGWTDPLLEEALAALAIGAAVVGLLTGAYAKVPPPARGPPPEPGGSGAWELSRELDRLRRERREVERERRHEPSRATELDRRLDRIRDEETALRARREAEYER